MVDRNAERDRLIDRMLICRGVRDAEAANAPADAWLREHPGDSCVLAAQERLDAREAGARDPDRETGRATLVAYACAFLGMALVVVFVLTGKLHAVGLAGLIVAVGLPWDGIGEAIVERRRGPRLSGPENGER